MHPREKLPQIQWLPEGTEPLSKFKLWYFEHKHALNARRKQKYRTDPAYREKVLLRSRAYHETYVAPKKYFKIAINGKLYEAYRRAQIFCFLGTFVYSLAKWEKKLMIPFCIFESRYRYYTYNQIGLLHEFMCLIYTQREHPKNEKVAARIQQHTLIMYRHWYDNSLQDSPEEKREYLQRIGTFSEIISQ